MQQHYSVIIVGAGPSGIGMAYILMKRFNIRDVIILEKDCIGSSFKNWPKEIKFYTPSYTIPDYLTKHVGLDYNSIIPSRAKFSVNRITNTEHATGEEYAKYLEEMVHHHYLPIKYECVKFIEKVEENFIIKTDKNVYSSTFLIWAGGEYNYPKKLKGEEYCLHFNQIKSIYDEKIVKLREKSLVIIGGTDHGVQLACLLSKYLNLKISIFDSKDPFTDYHPVDAKYSISVYTRELLKEEIKNIKIYKNNPVYKVEKMNDYYKIYTKNGEFKTLNQPIISIGYDGIPNFFKNLFHIDENTREILLNHLNDESSIHKNLFLIGPKVKNTHHEESGYLNTIYKFRTRLGIIGETIARRLELDDEFINNVIHQMKDSGFYLKVLPKTPCANCTCGLADKMRENSPNFSKFDNEKVVLPTFLLFFLGTIFMFQLTK